MSITLIDGTVLTDEDLDRICEDIDRGILPGDDWSGPIVYGPAAPWRLRTFGNVYQQVKWWLSSRGKERAAKRAASSRPRRREA